VDDVPGVSVDEVPSLTAVALITGAPAGANPVEVDPSPVVVPVFVVWLPPAFPVLEPAFAGWLAAAAGLAGSTGAAAGGALSTGWYTGAAAGATLATAGTTGADTT
jgi:hypothetical protein